MVKTLISWKFQTLINRFKHGKSVRMIILTVVLFLLWLLAFSITAGLAQTVSKLENADQYKLWSAIFGFTSFLAVLLPLRQMRSGKTGLGQFNFLPITKYQAYIKDWVDRLLMLQSLLFLILMLGFGLVVFPVQRWVLFIPILLGWVIMLQILTRIVFSLFQWLKSKSWYSQQIITIIIVLIYLGATNNRNFPVLYEYFSIFSDYWISSIFAYAVASPGIATILFALLTIISGLLIDRKLYHYLEERDDSPQPAEMPKFQLVTVLKLWLGRHNNIWMTILSRHPMFAASFLIFPIIVIFSSIQKLSMPILTPNDLDRFTISPMMFLSVIFASYGIGIIGYFANAHLSDRRKIKELMKGYKQIMIIFVTLISFLDTVIPVIYFREVSFIHQLWFNFFSSIGIACIVIDLMFMVNAFFVLNIPSKLSFNAGNQSDRVGMTIVSLIVMFCAVLLKIGLLWLASNLDNGSAIVTGISGFLILVSLLIMPGIYTRQIYSRRESIAEKVRQI